MFRKSGQITRYINTRPLKQRKGTNTNDEAGPGRREGEKWASGAGFTTDERRRNGERADTANLKLSTPSSFQLFFVLLYGETKWKLKQLCRGLLQDVQTVPLVSFFQRRRGKGKVEMPPSTRWTSTYEGWESAIARDARRK